MAKTPKKRAKVVKDDIVRMRVTADQKQQLTDAAVRDGLELSQWLRRVALRAAGALRDPK